MYFKEGNMATWIHQQAGKIAARSALIKWPPSLSLLLFHPQVQRSRHEGHCGSSGLCGCAARRRRRCRCSIAPNQFINKTTRQRNTHILIQLPHTHAAHCTNSIEVTSHAHYTFTWCYIHTFKYKYVPFCPTAHSYIHRYRCVHTFLLYVSYDTFSRLDQCN